MRMVMDDSVQWLMRASVLWLVMAIATTAAVVTTGN